MQVLHKHFLESGVRSHEPEQAQLFFIPVYLGRHYNWFWQQWSTPGSAWDVHADCRPEHTPAECFWEKWDGAKAVSGPPCQVLCSNAGARCAQHSWCSDTVHGFCYARRLALQEP